MASAHSAIAYVPVLHGGYLEFFRASKARELYVVGDELLKELDEFDYLVRKDSLRALPATSICAAIEALHMFDTVQVLEKGDIAELAGKSLVLPEEDVSHTLHKKYLSDCSVEYAPMFLRWHRDNAQEQKQVEAHRTVNVTDFDKEVLARVVETAQKSHDWWRQVAAAIVKDGEIVLIGNNRHLPDEQCPNTYGDPRMVYDRGVAINLTTAAHAEISLVAAAARRGMSLEGASMYLTDFPCPFCARMLVQSGIQKIYFTKGYAMLDGEKLLKDAGIEIVAVV